MNNRDEAVALLRHYFAIALGPRFSPDARIEVAEIVDRIIAAAREGIKAGA